MGRNNKDSRSCLGLQRSYIYSREVLSSSSSAHWLEVDLSDANVIVNGEFFVGFEWIEFSPEIEHPMPWLGVDKTEPHHGRSYLVCIGSLSPTPEKRKLREKLGKIPFWIEGIVPGQEVILCNLDNRTLTGRVPDYSTIYRINEDAYYCWDIEVWGPFGTSFFSYDQHRDPATSI